MSWGTRHLQTAMAGRLVPSVGVVSALAGIAMLSVVFAAGALGSTRTDQVTLTDNGQIGTATAHCPGNQRATGGGFSASPPMFTMSSYTYAQVFASRKVGQRGWRAAAEEVTSTPAEMTFTAYAYCAKHAPRTTSAVHAVPVALGASNFTASDASCSSGKARAGGFALSTPNYDGSLVASQRHGKRGWRTRIDGDGVTVTSYAYCAGGPVPKSRTGTVGSTGSELGTASSEPCPGGRPALAGGFAQPDAITGFAGSSYRNFVPYESKRSSSRWRTSGRHGGNTTSHLVAIAYCRG
jgi:hypothetical protein